MRHPRYVYAFPVYDMEITFPFEFRLKTETAASNQCQTLFRLIGGITSYVAIQYHSSFLIMPHIWALIDRRSLILDGIGELWLSKALVR